MSNDNCPTCGGVYVARCRCLIHDMRCAAGHEWHTCTVCGCVVPGAADHAAHAASTADRTNWCDRCKADPDRSDSDP